MKRLFYWFANPLLILVTLLAFVSMACSLSGNTIIVTATPSLPPSTATLSVPPTITPPPSPIPTATAVAQVAADQAKAAFHNGDYANALSIYHSLLDQPVLSVDPRLRTDAAYSLGITSLRLGKFDDAVKQLSDFITTYGSDPRVPEAYFVRGDAYMSLTQWASAITDFQTYIQKYPGVIDSYTYERIGDCYVALKQTDQALSSYQQASDSPRALEPMTALHEKVATAYLNTGNMQKALAQYDAILKIAQKADYRAQIALTAANLAYKLGDKTGALTRYQGMIADYPTTLQGYQALQALLSSGYAVDNYQRAKISYAAQDFNDAATALFAYTTQTPANKVDPEALVMLGHAYRQIGNLSGATTALQAVITEFPNTPAFGDAWLEQGQMLVAAQKPTDAITHYKQLAQNYPTLPQGAEALWRAAYLYSTLGDEESTLATYEILGTSYKGTDQAMKALFMGGTETFNKNDLARAQRFFNLLGTTGTGSMQASGYFWLGRIYQITNQPDYARIAYTAGAKADPARYYGLRSADLIAGHGPFVPPANLDLNVNDAAHIAEAENWMRTTFKLTQTGSLEVPTGSLATDFQRGDELLTVAADDQSQTEFESMRNENQGNPLALYELAVHLYNIGLNKESIYAAADLIDFAKITTDKAPKFIAMLRFPIAYGDLVFPAAQKYNVDPLLVFSVIRQESVFEGAATSYAAAQGLMQIIPDTGAYIAQKINWPDYHNSDVYKPYINVTFGVYYLREQLDTFNGDVPATLAAYNGGPGNSRQWYAAAHGDPDLFIQQITLDETKAYVTRIYEQYGMYTRIYAAK